MPRLRTWSFAVLGLSMLGGCIQSAPPASSAIAHQAEKPTASEVRNGAVQEQNVVVAEGTGEFTVSENDVVRLTGNTIAGGETSAVVKGNAKLVRINHILQLHDGESLVGAAISEFEVKPTGKGKVTVVITKTSPIPDVKPEDETVTFTVE